MKRERHVSLHSAAQIFLDKRIFSLRTVEEIANYEDIQYRLIKRFRLNAFDWTLLIERFWLNAFERTLSIERFRSNTSNRTLSIYWMSAQLAFSSTVLWLKKGNGSLENAFGNVKIFASTYGHFSSFEDRGISPLICWAHCAQCGSRLYILVRLNLLFFVILKQFSQKKSRGEF